GRTPHQYVMERRVERVKALLCDKAFGDRGIASIALACGFTDQSHLGRHFKRLVGVTPAAYRRNAK
ncbi:MAG: helix-turn-helix transcriptional regulator, partial [Planctomycetota bacterium]